jgi:hypothetical protein
MQTRSPEAMPSAMRPSAISRTISPTSAYVRSCHSPSTFSRSATLSACFCAAIAIRSAIVLEPVDAGWADVAVVASMELPSGLDSPRRGRF